MKIYINIYIYKHIYIYHIYKANIVQMNIYFLFFKKMRTSLLIFASQEMSVRVGFEG